MILIENSKNAYMMWLRLLEKKLQKQRNDKILSKLNIRLEIRTYNY